MEEEEEPQDQGFPNLGPDNDNQGEDGEDDNSSDEDEGENEDAARAGRKKRKRRSTFHASVGGNVFLPNLTYSGSTDPTEFLARFENLIFANTLHKSISFTY